MASAADKSDLFPLVKSHKVFFVTQISLRVLVVATTLASCTTTLTNEQTTVVFGNTTSARYNYSPAFEFFAYANLIACIFALMSLVLSFILGARVLDPTHYFYMFLHDLIMTVLLMAGCAASTAVGYVGKYGNNRAGWIPICQFFTKYCNRATAGTVLSYFGFLFCLILTVVSAHKSRHNSV